MDSQLRLVEKIMADKPKQPAKPVARNAALARALIAAARAQATLNRR